MKTKSKLFINWASFKAVKFACENWHYSKCVPVGKSIKVGAWEDEKFIGVVVFSRGANAHIAYPYKLKQDECCELTRIALGNHEHFVSEILAAAIRFLRQKSPNIKIIVSYADISQNHHGGVYQACNWIYEGVTVPARYFIVNGKKTHPKTISSTNEKKYSDFQCSLKWIKKHLDEKASVFYDGGKHKYIFVIDKKLRKQLIKKHLPYPKREVKE